MSKQITPKEAVRRFQREAQAFWEELDQWMDEHPETTLKEAEQHVRPLRRRLMDQALALQLLKRGAGVQAELPLCPHCGQTMEYKGIQDKPMVGMEFEGEIPRAYYHCPRCGEGLFPPQRPIAPEGQDAVD
jgi:ribosomal protein S27AE